MTHPSFTSSFLLSFRDDPTHSLLAIFSLHSHTHARTHTLICNIHPSLLLPPSVLPRRLRALYHYILHCPPIQHTYIIHLQHSSLPSEYTFPPFNILSLPLQYSVRHITFFLCIRDDESVTASTYTMSCSNQTYVTIQDSLHTKKQKQKKQKKRKMDKKKNA